MIPPRLRDRDVANRLRASALALYERHGYAATTADDIAADVGMSRRSLFNYYPAVDDIVFADHHLDYVPVLEETLQHPGDAYEVAIAALLAVVGKSVADREFAFRRRVVLASTPALRDRESLWYAQYERLLAKRLRTDQGESGVIADALAAGLVATLIASIDQWLIASSEEGLLDLFQAQLQRVVAPFRDGLRAEPTATRTRVVVISSNLTEDRLRQLLGDARPI